MYRKDRMLQKELDDILNTSGLKKAEYAKNLALKKEDYQSSLVETKEKYEKER